MNSSDIQEDARDSDKVEASIHTVWEEAMASHSCDFVRKNHMDSEYKMVDKG